MKCIGILLNSKSIEEFNIDDYNNLQNYSVLSDLKGNIFWVNPSSLDDRESLIERVNTHIIQSNGLFYILNMIKDEDEVFVNGVHDKMYEMHGKCFNFIKNNPKTKYISHEINKEDLNFTISLGSPESEIKDYTFKVRVKHVRISNIESSNIGYEMEYDLSYIGITHNNVTHRIGYPDDTYIKLRLFKDGRVACISDIKELIYLVIYGD